MDSDLAADVDGEGRTGGLVVDVEGEGRSGVPSG